MKKIWYTYIFALLVSQLLFAQSTLEKEELMYTFFDRGYEQIYIKKDSAYFYLEKALEMATAIEDHDSKLGILDHIIITADYHFDLTKYRMTLDRVESILSQNDIEKKIEDVNGWRIAYLSNLGGYRYKTKEYVAAKEIFLKVRSHFDSIPPKELLFDQADRIYSANSFLGTIYKHLKKYDLSEQYYLRNIALIESSSVFEDDSDAFRNGTYQLMAQLYTQMGKHAKANELYIENLRWAQTSYAKDKMFKNNLVNAFQKTTQSYIEQDSLHKALKILNQSLTYLLPDDPFTKNALLLYGDIHSRLNEKQEALDYYQQALTAFSEFRQNKPHQDVAAVHGKIATLFLEQKRYQDGLKSIQKAFQNAGINIEVEHHRENPDPNTVFSKTQLLSLLDIKLQLLGGKYGNSKNDEYLESALQTQQDILKTFDLLKSEFDSKLDKQFLAEKAYPMFERMLDMAHMAYEKDGANEVFELALNIAEKGKDFILMEALRNAQANQYGDVPQDVLDKEARLRAEITHVEKQIFEGLEDGLELSNDLFTTMQKYYDFLDIIKTSYPKYYKLKYQNTPVELTKVRKNVLNHDAVLVSYSMTEGSLYAFVIGGGHEKFLKLPFSEMDRESVGNFYRLLSRPSINGGEEQLADLGVLLFEKVLQKPLEGIETENLTIIPDGELHYLPFDLLRENGAYLLNTKRIGYGNSIASLLELRAKKAFDKTKVLAFAPSFTDAPAVNTDRQFGKLLYNDDEVSKLSAFYDTETVTDQNATLEYFRAQAGSDFNVFHLATHASANDEYPDYSYLAFTQPNDSTESNVLYIKDLYNTTMNADMVTLSACQTGIGKLQKGQGMLSLSKGFYYAGAKSLVNTLWKINDRSTVKLMGYFYEGLSEGQSKSEALRNAKLKYLQATDDNLLRHPYYWGAFVVSGDVSPISKKNYWWYIGGGLLFFVVVFFVAKRKIGA